MMAVHGVPALAPATLPATPAVTGTVLAAAVGMAIAGLAGPVVGVLVGTVLRPLQLGPEVIGAWLIMRDVAAGLLLAALLYGVLRSQIGALVGLEAGEPWGLLPRLALAALGVATSLSLVRGLLFANNALCAAILGALPAGRGGLARPLTGGLMLIPAAAAFSLASDAAALLILIGVAALVCFYIMRAAEIVLLTLLLPVAAALWVVPAAAGVWKALMAEILVSIFIQSVQVVVLLVFAAGMGVGRAAEGASWLWSIAALALLFRCNRLLRMAVGAVAQWNPGAGQVFSAGGPILGAASRGAQRVRAGFARVRDTAGI